MTEDSDKIERIDRILSELLTELSVLELERDEEILSYGKPIRPENN